MPVSQILDIIRVAAALSVLAYASISDLKTRRVNNYAWVALAAVGVIALFVQIAFREADWFYLMFTPLLVIVIYFLYRFRLIYGGADAKALIALAITFPFWPSVPLGAFPLWRSFFPFAYVILANSVLMLSLLPLLFLAYNLVNLRGKVEFPHCLLGFKIPTATARGRFLWPLEKLDDGKRRYVSSLRTKLGLDETAVEFAAAGIERIWVTPKIPFIVVLNIGLIVSLFCGDIISKIISLLV